MNSNMAWLLVKVAFPIAVAAAIAFGLGMLVLGVVYATGYRNESEPSLGERLKLRAKGLKLILQGTLLLLIVAAVTVSFFRTAAFGWIGGAVEWATRPDRPVAPSTQPVANASDRQLIENVERRHAQATRPADATPVIVRASLEPAEMRQFVSRLETMQVKAEAFRRLKERYGTVYYATNSESIRKALDETAYRQRREFGKVTDANLAAVLEELAALPSQPRLSNSYADLDSFASRTREKVVRDAITTDDVRAVPECIQALDKDMPLVVDGVRRCMVLRRKIEGVLGYSLKDSPEFLAEVDAIARNAGVAIPDASPSLSGNREPGVTNAVDGALEANGRDVHVVNPEPPNRRDSLRDVFSGMRFRDGNTQNAAATPPTPADFGRTKLGDDKALDDAARSALAEIGVGTLAEDLKPFLEAGTWQPGDSQFRVYRREPAPISLSALKSFGALENTEAGLQRLGSCTVTEVWLTKECGGTNLYTDDKMRSRSKLSMYPGQWTNEERRRLKGVQDFINKYMLALPHARILSR